jgi:hypothetical protein
MVFRTGEAAVLAEYTGIMMAGELLSITIHPEKHFRLEPFAVYCRLRGGPRKTPAVWNSSET